LLHVNWITNKEKLNGIFLSSCSIIIVSSSIVNRWIVLARPTNLCCFNRSAVGAAYKGLNGGPRPSAPRTHKPEWNRTCRGL
jgi:hypothetical protein